MTAFILKLICSAAVVGTCDLATQAPLATPIPTMTDSAGRPQPMAFASQMVCERYAERWNFSNALFVASGAVVKCVPKPD